MAAQLLLAGLPCFRASDKEKKRARERVRCRSNKEGAWQVLRENRLRVRLGADSPPPPSQV